MTTSVLARSKRLAALEIDKYTADIILVGPVLQSKLSTHLLDLGLDLLDTSGGVVSLADDGDQMRLSSRLVGTDALLEDALGLLDELAVEIDRVGLDATLGIVFAEDVFGGLLVVVVHLGGVRLALVGELLGSGAIAVFIGLSGLEGYRHRSACVSKGGGGMQWEVEMAAIHPSPLCILAT